MHRERSTGDADFGVFQIDHAVVRSDVLIDCIRTTTNPQVRNSALLLMSALAEIMPEPTLHGIMPIFTFMGANVLRQDDDFSVYVVKQVGVLEQRSIEFDADELADHGCGHPTSGTVAT